MFLTSLLLYGSICLLVFCILALVILLYCIVHISTSYDDHTDDEQQIRFLQNYSILK